MGHSPALMALIQKHLDAVIKNPNIKYSWIRDKERIELLEQQLKDANEKIRQLESKNGSV